MDGEQAGITSPQGSLDPFRVPIPSEEDVRTMRQLPLEADPPDHTEFRAIVAPAFQRPKTPEFIALL